MEHGRPFERASQGSFGTRKFDHHFNGRVTEFEEQDGIVVMLFTDSTVCQYNLCAECLP
jgi:hypothetical protein